MPPDYDLLDRFIRRHDSVIQALAVLVWALSGVLGIVLVDLGATRFWMTLPVVMAVPCWFFGYWAYLDEDEDGDNAR